MSSTTGADLCRVTILGPTRRVDVSLPAHVPFAQLFPAILRFSGENLADAGLAHGGWVLQRLDQAPFPGDLTPARAGLHDGELLYLRPAMSQLPEPSFDDVADVVATGVNELPDRWRPEWTAGFALGTAVAAVVLSVAILVLSGPPWVMPAAAAGTVALIALVSGISVGRAAGLVRAGAILCGLALPPAFVAGLLAPARDTPLADLGALHVLSGSAVVVLAATIAAVGVAGGVPVFLGVAVAALIGTAAAGAAMAFPDVPAAGIAAVTVTVTACLTPLLPAAAFRLARVSLPPVPRSAEDLRRDTLMVDGQQVLRRTALADRYVTGLVLGLALVGFGAQIPLAFAPGWLAATTSATVGVVLMLRSRLFRGRVQRLALMTAGVAGLGLLALAHSLGAGQPLPLASGLAPLLAGAAVVVAVGLWVPGHRPSPFWGRAADICDLVAVLALVPLALGVAGLFTFVRGLNG